jgi:hypothetical protein
MIWSCLQRGSFRLQTTWKRGHGRGDAAFSLFMGVLNSNREPKLLEIDVTHTKQSLGLISNRENFRFLQKNFGSLSNINSICLADGASPCLQLIGPANASGFFITNCKINKIDSFVRDKFLSVFALVRPPLACPELARRNGPRRKVTVFQCH